MAFTNPHPFWPIGYIVMEYIDAPNCRNRDYERVARAVDMLIHIEAPSALPGQVGGGEVVHSFFPDWASGIKYQTSKELQDHVNGVSEH